MQSIQRRLLALLVSFMVGFASVPAFADEMQENESPSAAAMVTDGLVLRPVLLGFTVIGAALFVVTLPVSAIGGNVKEAARVLVAEPAKATFTRCLGCTPQQDRSKQARNAE